MGRDPTSWLVTALIDELESLAVECREAAADRRCRATGHSLESVWSLNQAAETCDEIMQLIRDAYTPAVTPPRESA